MPKAVVIAAFLASLIPIAAVAGAAQQPHSNAPSAPFDDAQGALSGSRTAPSTVDRRDAAIFKDVAKQILTYYRFTVFDDVEASVTDGAVTLSGKVTMPFKRDDLGRRVTSVAGVKQVVNKIAVLPLSQFDDELRYRIARAIYGNPSFWQYTSMANPPIHIVVENGHVTLTGVVNNDVEKTLARSLAAQSNAFSVDSQLKTDAEMRAELEKVEKGSE